MLLHNLFESSDPNVNLETAVKRIVRDACRHVAAPKPGQIQSPLENNITYNRIARVELNKTDGTRTWAFAYNTRKLASQLIGRTGPLVANIPDGWKTNTILSLTKHVKKVIILIIYGISRENMGLKAIGIRKAGETKFTPIPIREFDVDKYVVGTEGSFQLIFDTNNAKTWNIDVARRLLEGKLAPIAKTIGFKLGQADWKNIKNEKIDKFDWAWPRQVKNSDTVLVLRQPGVYRLDEAEKAGARIDFKKLYSGSDEAAKASINKALTDKLEKNQKGNIIAVNSRSAALKALLKEADPILKEYNKTAFMKISYSIQKIELEDSTYSRYSDSIVFRFKKATK